LKGIVSNPNIAPHVKESVLAYQENHLLANFYTTFIEHSKYPLSRVLSFIFPNLIKEFKRRSFEELSYHLVKTKPCQELLRVAAARKLNPIITDKIWERNELSFDRWVASKLKEDLSFVHVTEHAALATIKKAKNINIKIFYEQPSIHHQEFTKIINNQLIKYPAFDTEAIKLLNNSDSFRRNQRRDEELSLADFIICNSTFTKNSLINAGIKETNILTIPLGFPEVKIKTIKPKKVDQLIFISAGNLSLGKGSHILLQAWQDLSLLPDQAELWLIGKNNLPAAFMHELPQNIKFFGNIPRNELMEMYTKAHILVHPTLADGFGMVISEAMSCGIPVITTHNSAGPDIIIHEKSGLLINADDKLALKNSILWCLQHKTELIEMGNQALKTAAAYPWAAYRKNLVSQVQNSLKFF